MAAASALSAVVELSQNLMRNEEEIMQLRKDLAELEMRIEVSKSLDIELEKDILQLAYNIEDTFESYVRVREGVVGKPYGSFRKYLAGKSFKDDVSVFQKKASEAKSRMGNHKRLGAAVELETETSYLHSSQINANNVIGREWDVEMLSSHLLEGENRHSVVAIVGVGGIGKTTLARSLFDHPPVKKHFDVRIWAHGGVDFQARRILEYVLSIFYSDGRTKKIEEMESMELMEGIYKALAGKRYLVVLDEIWSSDNWETIRYAFPNENNGSRVIITSRQKDVARRSPNYTHEMMPLTLKESWELLKTRLGHQDLDEEAQTIGRRIIELCRGVPLDIVVVASQFRFEQLEDWKKLLQLLPEDKNLNKSRDLLCHSYNLLPVHLKPCFLYLGHFPVDHEILIEKLYLLWIAEGFISAKDIPNISKSKFDIAENYLKALVNRSMVMIQEEEVSDTQRSKRCRIHDLLRDTCLQKGKEEEFLRVVDFGRVNNKAFVSHRLAIYLNMRESADGDNSIYIPEAKSVRSLLFFEKNEPLTKSGSRWPVEFADLKGFGRARVLDFDGVDFRVKQLPKNIKRLVYLRYLSFRGCYLLEFPSFFSNLTFLEILDLLVQYSCRITISNILWNFRRLRHLYLPVVFQIDSKAQDRKLKLNGLTELEILRNFHAGLCDANDLEMLKNVKSFTGVVDGNNDDLEKIVERLIHWKITSSGQSSLVVKNFDCYSEKRLSIVKKLFTRCKSLPALEIEGHLPRLPSYTEISPNFTEMVFSGSEFEQDPMQILGKLPKLRTLVLSNNAFPGYEMVCSESDFPQLVILKLAMLQRLREWKVNSGAMPNLALLAIEQCKDLQKLPDELMEIATLQELKIGSMPRKFQQNVRSMAEKPGVHAKVRVSAY